MKLSLHKTTLKRLRSAAPAPTADTDGFTNCGHSCRETTVPLPA